MEGMGSAVQPITSQLSFASVVTLLRGTAVSTELTSWFKTNHEGKNRKFPSTRRTQNHGAGTEPCTTRPPSIPLPVQKSVDFM